MVGKGLNKGKNAVRRLFHRGSGSGSGSQQPTPESEQRTPESQRPTPGSELRTPEPQSRPNEDDLLEAHIDIETTLPPQPRRRGASVLRPAPTNPDRRPVIHLDGGRLTDNAAIRDVTTIWRSMFAGPWARYVQIPHENLVKMFEEFENRYQWPGEDDSAMFEAFNYTLQSNYADKMRDLRNAAGKRAEDRDGIPWDKRSYERLRGLGPDWIHVDFWEQMIDQVWLDPVFIRQSAANTANRARSTASRHTGGSVSTVAHRSRMRDAWNREPTIIEVFERTHCTNRDLVPGSTGPPTDAPIFLDGSHEGWSSSWHQTARAEYPDVDDPRTLSQEIQAQVWQKANPSKKDRVPGFNRVKDFLGLTGQGRRSCSAAPSDVEALRAELEEERKQRRLEQEAAAERWRKYEEERQRDARQQFEGFMQQFLSQNPSQMQAFMQQFQNQNQNPDQNPDQNPSP